MIGRNLLRDALDANGEEALTIKKTGKGRFELIGEGIRATITTEKEETDIDLHATNDEHFNKFYQALTQARAMQKMLTGKADTIVIYANKLARAGSPTIQRTFQQLPQTPTYLYILPQ